ncbi:survival of motor neuron-related-splicing factor 30-like [Dromiciops gliroides]|uniref:survival of motor neuron-related-splicing factor 30-like n=1 Tax=Dromiciops gliroides TaxID=33562 RepID=UPI001CC6B114|nr:survival of motor neuron-related-splicing factor 30-like [Dromiciops gliroides]
MCEELVAKMINYKVQLEQVEAALYQNQENEDLLKLKRDLQEVIELTKQLISSDAQPSSSLKGAEDDNDVCNQRPSWKVGDDCMAIWSKNGQYYKAKIEEIDKENEAVTISFDGYATVEVTSLLNLKPIEEEKELGEADRKAKAKKEKLAQQREYKRKKAWKKAQRAKEIDQQREDQKDKWQKFHNKTSLKKAKGQIKKSIFASPETLNGKVGVGTCGIADKPMTQFQDNSKYNVRHLMPQ